MSATLHMPRTPPPAPEHELRLNGNDKSRAEQLNQRRFNHRVRPPEIRPVYTLLGKPVATPGNLVSVASAVKTGKSAVIGAMCAAAMANNETADLLGFGSCNPHGRILMWFDSEQSPYDFWHCVNRAIRRAGLTAPPNWLRAYCLTGLEQTEALECVKLALEIAAQTRAGIHSVLLDGLADLVKDPNDAGECNKVVAELHSLAIEHNCPIVGVIHFNPNSTKTRGHLGSQFERKSESNLQLDKDKDGVTEIWSDKQRRAPIPEGTGPCFQWDDNRAMHVTVENPAEAEAEAKAEAKRESEQRDAEMCFAQAKDCGFAHGELVQIMCGKLELKPSGARARLSKWFKAGIVRKNDSDSYVLKSC